MPDATLSFATNRDPSTKSGRIVGFGERFHPTLDELRFGRAFLSFTAADAKRFTSAEAVRDFAASHPAAKIEVYGESIENDVRGSEALFAKLREQMEGARDSLVFLHGYNVSFHEALATGYGLQWYLRTHHQRQPVNVTCFSWPSDGRMTPWIAYRSDRLDARTSGPAVARAFLKLRDFVARLPSPCSGRIHLLCHSMGNYVMESALAELIAQSSGPRLPRLFDEIILAAPDVDADALERDDKLARLPELARRVTVYMHTNDRALQISDATKGHPDRLGQAGPANSRKIPDKIDVVDCSHIPTDVTKHSYFLEPRVLMDLARVVAGVSSDELATIDRQYVERLRRFVLAP